MLTLVAESHLTLGYFPQFFTNIKQDFFHKNVFHIIGYETVQGASHSEMESTGLKAKLREFNCKQTVLHNSKNSYMHSGRFLSLEMVLS